MIVFTLAVAPAATTHAARGHEPRQAVAVEAAQPTVLVLTVDDLSIPYMRVISEEFSNVALSAPNPPALYFESLDLSRFEQPDYLEGLRDWLRRKYVGRRIDLVVAVGEDVVGFLSRKRGEPWPDVPVLYMVGSVSVDPRKDLPLASGLSLNDHFPGILATIKTILPETERVVLVYGASGVDRTRLGAYADKVRAANLGLVPIEWVGLPVDTIVSRVAQLPGRTVVFILTPYIDASGRTISLRQTCELSAAASVPLFMLSTLQLGCGGVGGLMRDFTLVGRLLADEALARLTNRNRATDVGTVPMARTTTLAFDARQLARWNIPENRLPAGSTVLFREPNLWRDRRPLVIAAIAVTLGQALLIVGLVFEHRRRQRAELQGRRSLATMAHLNRQAALGALATSLAHELNQPLNAILQNAGAAQMMLTSKSGPPPVDDVLDILDDIQKDDTRAGEVIRSMRALLQKHELEKTPLEVNAFVRETVALVLPDAMSRGIQMELDLVEGLPRIHGDRIHLQQVLLNLLLNGMEAVADMPPDRRHVRVRTTHSNGYVEVAVTDRGGGIAEESLSQIFDSFYTTKGKGMGMGLSIARSIMEAHNGRLSAENNPEGGATVYFSLPACA